VFSNNWAKHARREQWRRFRIVHRAAQTGSAIRWFWNPQQKNNQQVEVQTHWKFRFHVRVQIDLVAVLVNIMDTLCSARCARLGTFRGLNVEVSCCCLWGRCKKILRCVSDWTYSGGFKYILKFHRNFDELSTVYRTSIEILWKFRWNFDGVILLLHSKTMIHDQQYGHVVLCEVCPLGCIPVLEYRNIMLLSVWPL
jgi:hypothetical protein